MTPKIEISAQNVIMNSGMGEISQNLLIALRDVGV